MAVGPHKAFESMTEDERREWKEWLLAKGKSPLAVSMPRSLSGSSYIYDDRTGEVVEHAGDGSRYVIAIRDGQIVRVEELIGEPLRT